MFQPDNFFYFTFFFSLSIGMGTYLMSTYAHDRLVLMSSVIFLLCAGRFACEFYLPRIEALSDAELLGVIQTVFVSLICLMIYYCTWSYIRPFRDNKNERIYNRSFLLLLIFLPIIVLGPPLLGRELYTFHPEKIDGYWQFTINTEHWSYLINNLYTLVIMPITMFLLMFLSIKSRKGHRIKQSLISLSYIIIPGLWYLIIKDQDIHIPNSGILYFSQAALVCWFVSDYRLFENSHPPGMLPILESIKDIAIYTGKDYRIQHYNTNAKNTFRNIQNGTNIWDLLGTNNDTNDENSEGLYLDKSYRDHTIVNEIEIKETGEKGIKNTFQVRVSKYLRRKKLIGYTFVIIDVSASKRYEKELKAINDMKNNLFLVITHDLKRPLNSFNDVSKKINYLLSNKQYERLQDMGKQFDDMIQSARKISIEVFNWVLEQKNNERFKSEEIEIKKLIESQIEFHKFYADMHDINIVLKENKSFEDLKVHMNYGALQTVIRNILWNAIEHSIHNSEVIVEINYEDYHCKMKVTNSCLNTNEMMFNNIENILEKDKRVGLYIVQELIEINGGNIEFQIVKDNNISTITTIITLQYARSVDLFLEMD